MTGWDGELGRSWAGRHDAYDAMAEPVNAPLFEAAAIDPTDHVLDIGCGTGLTTRLAARHAIRGRAVGIDVSFPMLDRARELTAAEGITNALFELADAQTHPFPEEGFQVAISRAGVMFFDDAVAAFANIRRALAPGGRLAFVCHRQPPAQAQTLMAAVAGQLPMPADRFPGVAAFTDPGHIRQVLSEAGFTGVEIDPVDYLSPLASTPGQAADLLLHVHFQVSAATTDADAVDRARQALVDVLTPLQEQDAVRLPAAAWLVTADRPGW